MAEGYTLEGEDFEGRPCSYCGTTIDFAELMRDPDAELVTWDVRVHEPGEPEPDPYVHRYYYCSEERRHDAKRSPAYLRGDESYGKADTIHIDDVDGVV